MVLYAKQVVTNPSMEQRRTEYKALEFLTHPQLFFVAYAQVGSQKVLCVSRKKSKK